MTATIRIMNDTPADALYVVNDARCGSCGRTMPIEDHVTRWHGGRAMATGQFVRSVATCDCGGRYAFALERVIGIGVDS